VAANKKIFIGPGEGAHLPVLDITHKVTAESFGGAFTIIEVGLPPGEMIPPHTHAREDECAFVLEGELTFDVGGEIVLASAGSFVLEPRGAYHAFCNTGTVHNRHLEIHAPVSSRATTTSTSGSSRARWARTSAGRPASNWERATGLSGTRSSSPRSEPASG
jgi:quercetin dioxygenase-like cupin family protein